MKSRFIIIFIFSILSGLSGCSDNEFENDSAGTNLSETDAFRQELSLLIGRVLLDESVRSEVVNIMQKFDPDETSVSLAFLLDNEEGMKESEIPVYQASAETRSASKLFQDAFYREFNNMSSELKLLNKKVSELEITRASPPPKPPEIFLIPLGYELFFPYADHYEFTGKENYYVTYAPENELQLTNSAQLYNVSGNVQQIADIPNEFLDDNPVFILIPIDHLLPIEDFNPIEDTDPPYPDPVTTLLTTNVNHQNIKEEDILTTNLPRIMINGVRWMGFGGRLLKLTIVRATADGVPKIVDGKIEIGPNQYRLDKNIKRKYIAEKHRRWIALNHEFDPDWNMSENTQGLFIFSRHFISGKASIESSVKVGLKIENGVIVPTAEASMTVKVDITIGHAKFRANKELSRRQVLATIVGPGTTGRTYTDPETGINFNLKNASIMDYYFEHYLTKLSN